MLTEFQRKVQAVRVEIERLFVLHDDLTRGKIDDEKALAIISEIRELRQSITKKKMLDTWDAIIDVMDSVRLSMQTENMDEEFIEKILDRVSDYVEDNYGDSRQN